jgi:hypothetical protein
MSLSNYIPLSIYLQESDVHKFHSQNEAKFQFSINQKKYFYIYKSLACFLSPKASECLFREINELNIPIFSLDFDLTTIRKSLLELLSGQPIEIHQNNFYIFRQVFEALGNPDFQEFFGETPPKIKQDFYLSINSLKHIPTNISGEQIYSPSYLRGFSVSHSLIHFFGKSRFTYHQNSFLISLPLK